MKVPPRMAFPPLRFHRQPRPFPARFVLSGIETGTEAVAAGIVDATGTVVVVETVAAAGQVLPSPIQSTPLLKLDSRLPLRLLKPPRSQKR